MIVKNESEVLRRALDGVKNLCDEIVIVDTGSTDDTKQIAREYTDKVFDFPWCDDFSAARNFALGKITTDYWLWLDADDILSPRTASAISKFMRAGANGADVIMLPYVLSTDGRGKPTFSYYRERIMKTDGGFRWEGRVHEAVAPHGRIEKLPYPVLHAKPSGRSNGSRNLDIYRRAAARGDVFSPRETYYYARELYFNGDEGGARKEFERFLTMPGGFYVNKIDACVMLSRIYRQAGDSESALGFAAYSFIYGPPSGEACCELGELYFDKGDYATAAQWYGLAVRLKPDGKDGAFVDGERYGFIPLLQLTVCYDRMGEHKKAFRYHLRAERRNPNHPSVAHNREYFARLGMYKQRNT